MIEIYEGDCLAIMAGLPSASIDMILTDLPYGTTYAPWDCTISLEGLWDAWLRVTKPGAAIVLTASQPFTSALVMSKPRLFRCEWVWDKVNAANFANANRQPLKTHESVLVFATEQTTYNPQKTLGQKNHAQGKGKAATKREGFIIRKRAADDASGLKFPKSIQVFPKHSSQSKLHSAQKPTPLFEYLVRTYSNEGDVVLDCAAGSGTTGEAAHRSARRALLIDNDPKCIATMRERLPFATCRQT
jgi:site-specific DNA-methyltransferase (adenine-specific)